MVSTSRFITSDVHDTPMRQYGHQNTTRLIYYIIH